MRHGSPALSQGGLCVRPDPRPRARPRCPVHPGRLTRPRATSQCPVVALTGRSKWLLLKRPGVLPPRDRAHLGGREQVVSHRPGRGLLPAAQTRSSRDSGTRRPVPCNATTRITLEHAVALVSYFAFCPRRPLKCEPAEGGDFSPFPDEHSGPTSGPEVCNGHWRKTFFL